MKRRHLRFSRNLVTSIPQMGGLRFSPVTHSGESTINKKFPFEGYTEGNSAVNETLSPLLDPK